MESRIRRAFETIKVMLNDRKEKNKGYEPDEEITKETIKQIIDEEQKAKYKMITFTRSSDKNTITVIWVPNLTEKSIPDATKSLAVLANKNNTIYNVILFCPGYKYNAKILENIEKLKRMINIEIFTLTELVFPIAHHVYVKPHRKLSKEEKEEVYQYYQIKDDDDAIVKLPILLNQDAIAKYYGFQTYDLVVIDENENPYIRIVFPNLKEKMIDKTTAEKE